MHQYFDQKSVNSILKKQHLFSEYLQLPEERAGETEALFPDLFDSTEAERDLELTSGEGTLCPESLESFNSDPSRNYGNVF